MSYIVIDPPAVYLATCGAEPVAHGHDLEGLIAELQESVTTEDAAVWRGEKLVALVRADGRVFRFSA